MQFMRLEEMLKSKMNFFILNRLNKPKSTNNVLFKGLEDQVNWLIGQFATEQPRSYWKTQFSIDVLPDIEQGWRPVVRDEQGLCLNCYHYGDGEQCMNHRSVELNDEMSFSQYKMGTAKFIGSITIYVANTFEGFKSLRAEEIRREDEAWERVIAAADRAITAHFAEYN